MLTPTLAVLATAWLVGADDNTQYNVLGSIAFIRSGEHTPLLRPTTPVLTARGAQQMFELGQNFRMRYLVQNSTEPGLGVQNIRDISPNILRPQQLYIQALDKPYLVSSAQAFLQGLYPPYTENETTQGILGDAVGSLADGSKAEFPLQGYQYPNIQVLGDMDPQSVYISGNEHCPSSQLDSALYEATDHFMEVRKRETKFYEGLDLSWFDGYLNSRQTWLDYRYAYEIYDYLSYAYAHDSSTHEALANNTNYTGVYDRVRYLADQDAYYRYANTTTLNFNDDRAMAGKTLSARILGQFQKIISNRGNTTDGDSEALSLLFGDFEPILSFLSLARVGHNSAGMRAIPPFASTMFFELHSKGNDDDFPDKTDDLWVRFYFHNASQEFNGKPTAYSLFGTPNSMMDMKWSEFQTQMARIMVNQLSDWCDTCSSGSLFCWGVDDTTVNVTVAARNKPKISAPVAGAIGAVVTLAVAGLLFALAMFFGGIRFHRVHRDRKSELGGFKGSAKLASDPDLSLSKNAAPPAGIVSFGKDGDRKVGHERVGSWELRQKEIGGAGDITRASPRESFEAIETAMRKPVEPTERV